MTHRSSMRSKWDKHQVMASTMEDQVFTIHTPMGPKEVLFGKWNKTFTVEYRSEEAKADSLPSLMKQITRIESEHQVKAARDTKRRQVAKTPQEAILLTGGQYPVRSEGYEEVKVRGFDLRSGYALVVRANGDKDQASWVHLLNPLDDSDLQDLLTLQRKVREAEAAVKEWEPKSAGEALKPLKVDLRLHFDPESRVVWTEHDGRRYEVSAEDDDITRTLEGRVLARILMDAGYEFYDSQRNRRPTWTRLTEESVVWQYYGVIKDQADLDALLNTERILKGAEHALGTFVEEFAFDKSLVMVQDDPEPQSDEPQVVSVRAPEGSGDWED